MCRFIVIINPLSASRTKLPNTLKQFAGKLSTNVLSVFGHFMKLGLKGLMMDSTFVKPIGFYLARLVPSTEWKQEQVVGYPLFLCAPRNRENVSTSILRPSSENKKWYLGYMLNIKILTEKLAEIQERTLELYDLSSSSYLTLKLWTIIINMLLHWIYIIVVCSKSY